MGEYEMEKRLCGNRRVMPAASITIRQSKTTEWQRIRDKIKAAFVFARAYFVNVQRRLASDISNRKSSTHISDSV